MPPEHASRQFAPVCVLVTGASGELGAALAARYAATGVTLLLWGRDPVRLEHVANTCRRASATVIVRQLDLVDTAAAVAAIEQDDRDHPIDIALLVAGLGDTLGDGELAEDPAQVTRLGIVNFVAPSAVAAALARLMGERRRGKIVLIGSAAAFHALPFAASYAASKAGLARFAQALRIGMEPHGVQVTLVSPGFIDTAAGRSTPGPKPFLMQPAAVADRIAQAAARGKAHLVLPWPFALLRVFDRILPARLRDRLLLSLAPPGR